MQKLTLPLEVGKKYVCRDGTIVECHAKANTGNWAPGLVQIRVANEPTKHKGTIWQDTGSNGKSGDEYRNDVVADYVEVTGHVHAELMAEYAKDAAQNAEPWKDWQITMSYDPTGWVPCLNHPSWATDRNYRRKPATVTINGIVVKKGLTDVNYDELVFLTTLSSDKKYVTLRFEGLNRQSLQRGLIHATKEDAIAMADAMLAFKAD